MRFINFVLEPLLLPQTKTTRLRLPAIFAMSCQDDLTAVDLSSNVAVEVLERVSAGSGRDENLWSFIDINK